MHFRVSPAPNPAYVHMAAIWMPPHAAVSQAKFSRQRPDVIHWPPSDIARPLAHIAGTAPMVQRVAHVAVRRIAADRWQASLAVIECIEEADEPAGIGRGNDDYFAIIEPGAGQAAMSRVMVIVVAHRMVPVMVPI